MIPLMDKNEMENQNWIDPSAPTEIQTLAQLVVSEFDLSGLRVRYDSEKEALIFTQDRRVVDLPVALVKDKKWRDIAYLFRAILGSAPGAWNLSADDNDWSAYKE